MLLAAADCCCGTRGTYENPLFCATRCRQDRAPFAAGCRWRCQHWSYLPCRLVLTLPSCRLRAPCRDFATFTYKDKFRKQQLWFPDADASSNGPLDLLKKIFIFDQEKRITVEEAIQHPYFAAHRNLAFEATTPTKFDSTFETQHLDTQGWYTKCCQDVIAARTEAVANTSFAQGMSAAYGVKKRVAGAGVAEADDAKQDLPAAKRHKKDS